MAKLKRDLTNDVDNLIIELEQLCAVITKGYKEIPYPELELFIQCKYLTDKDIFLYRGSSKYSTYKLLKLYQVLNNVVNRNKELIQKYSLLDIN